MRVMRDRQRCLDMCQRQLPVAANDHLSPMTDDLLLSLALQFDRLVTTKQ